METIGYIDATSYDKHLPSGTTNPFILSCNGKYYVTKAFDEHNLNKHLVNEYVSYHLAKLCDLPIPDAKLIRVNNELINSVPKLANSGIRSLIMFGSELLQNVKANVTPVDIDILINTEDIPSIILFDQIILNDDRAKNSGNLLFDFKNKYLYVIDHSHVFRDGLIWTPDSLDRLNEERAYLIRDFHKKIYKNLQQYVYGRDPFHKILSSLRQINSVHIDSIIDSIPVEWEVGELEKKALKRFLNHRITHIDQILLKIKDECPYWKGVI